MYFNRTPRDNYVLWGVFFIFKNREVGKPESRLTTAYLQYTSRSQLQ